MKKPYIQRLRALTWNVIISYRNTMPETWHAVRNAWSDLVVALVVFGMNILGLLALLVFPFTFFLSPLYLWFVDKSIAKRKREQEATTALWKAGRAD